MLIKCRNIKNANEFKYSQNIENNFYDVASFQKKNSEKKIRSEVILKYQLFFHKNVFQFEYTILSTHIFSRNNCYKIKIKKN